MHLPVLIQFLVQLPVHFLFQIIQELSDLLFYSQHQSLRCCKPQQRQFLTLVRDVDSHDATDTTTPMTLLGQYIIIRTRINMLLGYYADMNFTEHKTTVEEDSSTFNNNNYFVIKRYSQDSCLQNTFLSLKHFCFIYRKVFFLIRKSFLFLF